MSHQVMLTPQGEVKLAGFHATTDALGTAQSSNKKDDVYKVSDSCKSL